MTNKRKILNLLIVILSLFGIQTLTYLTIGQKLLKNKLLPGHFATLAHHSDSVFVRDFHIADNYSCLVDANTYTSHNLSSDKEFIKEKLNADFVYFDSQERTDTIENKFNLNYYTWTARPDWVTLFGLYGVRQTEVLITRQRHQYIRETTYHWFLFFWVPTFEWLESADFG